MNIETINNDTFVNNIGESSNGRTHPSGGWYWGSSPCSPAHTFYQVRSTLILVCELGKVSDLRHSRQGLECPQ